MDYVQGTWKVPTRKLSSSPQEMIFFISCIVIASALQSVTLWMTMLSRTKQAREAGRRVRRRHQARHPFPPPPPGVCQCISLQPSLQQPQPFQAVSDLSMTHRCMLCPAMLSFRHLLPRLFKGHSATLSEIIHSLTRRQSQTLNLCLHEL